MQTLGQKLKMLREKSGKTKRHPYDYKNMYAESENICYKDILQFL